MTLKRMSIEEFRSEGFLQEANRLFFHPLGLALEVVVDDDGTESLGGIWDYRDDPAGVVFGPDMIERSKAVRVEAERLKHAPHRREILQGFIIQGVPNA